jgi:DNA-binding XRE family transcriptional regulator
MKLTRKEIFWSPALIKKLRGKRTQQDFGSLLGVPKNTVWRWEVGQVRPTGGNAKRLSELADQEHFLRDWKLRGSIEVLGDLEKASTELKKIVEAPLARSTRILDN